MEYPNSIPVLEDDLRRAPDTEVTDLAREIIERAKECDMLSTSSLPVYTQYTINDKVISRNRENPIEYTHQSVLGAPGADTAEKPLGDGEIWNKDRRATSTGAIYQIGEDGRPINPYHKTGITGQGLLWQYGPNHAVDIGVIVTKNDENGVPTLYTEGIRRKDSMHQASFAGGFLKYEQGYKADKETVLNSRVEEFFEEMLSGSIELLPEYQERVNYEFGAEVLRRMEKRTSAISEEKLKVIKEQIVTKLKMDQTKDKDPELFPRLKEVFSEAKECYAGPILNAGRSTDNSWIESNLAWIHLTDQKMNYIKGKNSMELSAGDDAGAVVEFKVDDKLIANSSRSHRAMFAFMTASFLLDSQEKGQKIDKNIIKQLYSVSDKLQEIIDTNKNRINAFIRPKF